MKSLRDTAILAGTTLTGVVLFRHSIKRSLGLSAERWREDPAKQVERAILSAMVGQGLSWGPGYDQLGVLMNTKVEFGLGQKLAKAIYAELPESPRVAWAIKIVEILADASRIPVEAKLYRDYGVTPDVVADLVTQPLWTVIEVAEKAAGAIAYPERVVQSEAVKVSIGCIYGSAFRHLTGGLVFVIGKAVTARQ